MGATQLLWLEQELSSAAAEEQQVVIMSHSCIHPELSGDTQAWNHRQVLSCLHKSDCVRVVLSANQPTDEPSSCTHLEDERGIHHVLLSASVLYQMDRAYCTVALYPNMVNIRGEDRMPSYKLFFGDEQE